MVMLRVKIIYRATSGGDGLEPNSIMEAEEKGIINPTQTRKSESIQQTLSKR